IDTNSVQLILSSHLPESPQAKARQRAFLLTPLQVAVKQRLTCSRLFRFTCTGLGRSLSVTHKAKSPMLSHEAFYFI
ncbi:MAG: hypothetical protein N6V49_04910, partial [Serratia symbiotica]|nr:hypothetical protein [Serratia symbiotica]